MVAENLREAATLALDDEDLAMFGMPNDPVVPVTFEVEPAVTWPSSLSDDEGVCMVQAFGFEPIAQRGSHFKRRRILPADDRFAASSPA